MVEILLMMGKLWLVVGLLFGLVFVWRGAARVEPAARESGWGLRVLLLPGCAVFWPRLAWLWWKGEAAPVESSSHRRAAAREV
jgi:hypothetical protein